MNKKLILAAICIAVVISGIFIWHEKSERWGRKKLQVYKTQAECEKATGRQCTFGGCDYKCPKGKYWKGWVATSKKISDREICVDSDGGKDIYTKGSAATKAGNQTIHINSDSCADQTINNTSNKIEYNESSKCAGDYRHSCYISEGYCKEYQGSLIDAQEFIQCPNGCSDGACLNAVKADNQETLCVEEQRGADVCAEIYAPVCATVEIQCIKAPCNPIQETFPNACEACKNSLVKSYVNGECAVNN